MIISKPSGGSNATDHGRVSAEWLRSRAAHYRELMAKTTDPRRVKRYRDLSELLDEAAETLERHN